MSREYLRSRRARDKVEAPTETQAGTQNSDRSRLSQSGCHWPFSCPSGRAVNPQLSLATRGEDWASQGQPKWKALGF